MGSTQSTWGFIFAPATEMKLSICLVFISISLVKGLDGDPPCEPFSVGCNTDPYLAKFECKKDEPCTCADAPPANPDSQENCPAGFEDLPSAELNSEKCKEICASDSTKCKYYRWEQDTIPEAHTQCFLLKDCSEYLACSADTEGVHHCESGQIECTNNPEPETTNCNPIATDKFLDQPGAVHWTCLNQYHLDETVIIYKGDGTDQSIKPGTICWTAQGCKAFDNDGDDEKGEMDYHKIVVQCNDATPDNLVEDGQWVKYIKSDNKIDTEDNMAISTPGAGNNLQDLTCRPEDLVLTASNLNQVGVAFICDLVDDDHYVTDDTHITLKEYNTCYLLCNFHHVMTIQPKFGEDPQWFRYYPDGGEIDKATALNVKCW